MGNVMKNFICFSLSQITKGERAAMLLAALLENICVLLVAWAFAGLIDDLADLALADLIDLAALADITDLSLGNGQAVSMAMEPLNGQAASMAMEGEPLNGQYAAITPNWQLMALLASALILRAGLGACQRELLSVLSGRVGLVYRQGLHRYFFCKHGIYSSSGRLAELCCEHVETMDEFFYKVVTLAVNGAIRLPLFLAVFFSLDAVSGLIAFAAMPIAPVLLYLMGKMAARASAAQWDRQWELNKGFYELLQGIVTLKLFGRTAAALKEMESLSRSYGNSSLQVLRIAFLSAFAVELLTTLAIAVLAVSIGLRLLAGGIDFFTGFLILLLSPEFFMPVRSAGMAFHVVMNTRTALSTIEGFVDLAAPEKDAVPLARAASELAGRAAALESGEGRIQAGKAAAQYEYKAGGCGNELEKQGQACDIVIPAGSFAVVTGSSGAGKTTLLQRLAGLLPTGGSRFWVAGYDLGALTMEQRQGLIGYVPQEPHVYAASLRDNLLLGRSCPAAGGSPDEYSGYGGCDGHDRNGRYERYDKYDKYDRNDRHDRYDGYLEELLELAGLADWYRSTGGMDTLLGDGGLSLSNGQRHRLGLARALAGSPAILLLDEVTAGLEEQEEEWLLDRLLHDLAGTTILLATHRRQAVRRAWQIIEVTP